MVGPTRFVSFGKNEKRTLKADVAVRGGLRCANLPNVSVPVSFSGDLSHPVKREIPEALLHHFAIQSNRPILWIKQPKKVTTNAALSNPSIINALRRGNSVSIGSSRLGLNTINFPAGKEITDRQCILFPFQGKCYLLPLSHVNLMTLNGKKVSAFEPVLLGEGDEIRVENIQFKFSDPFNPFRVEAVQNALNGGGEVVLVRQGKHAVKAVPMEDLSDQLKQSKKIIGSIRKKQAQGIFELALKPNWPVKINGHLLKPGSVSEIRVGDLLTIQKGMAKEIDFPFIYLADAGGNQSSLEIQAVLQKALPDLIQGKPLVLLAESGGGYNPVVGPVAPEDKKLVRFNYDRDKGQFFVTFFPGYGEVKLDGYAVKTGYPYPINAWSELSLADGQIQFQFNLHDIEEGDELSNRLRALYPAEYDLSQGELKDCYLLNALFATYHTAPSLVKRLIVPLKSGNWRVTLIGGHQTVVRREDLDAGQNIQTVNGKTYKPLPVGPEWAVILERAIGRIMKDYANRSGGNRQTLPLLDMGGSSASLVTLLTGEMAEWSQDFTDFKRMLILTNVRNKVSGAEGSGDALVKCFNGFAKRLNQKELILLGTTPKNIGKYAVSLQFPRFKIRTDATQYEFVVNHAYTILKIKPGKTLKDTMVTITQPWDTKKRKEVSLETLILAMDNIVAIPVPEPVRRSPENKFPFYTDPFGPGLDYGKMPWYKRLLPQWFTPQVPRDSLRDLILTEINSAL